MKWFKSKKRKLKEECWNLDFEIIKWLNEHLKVLVEECPKVIDLEYHKYKYKNKEYTQKEFVEELINITDYLLNNEPYSFTDEDLNIKYIEKINTKKNDMYDMLKIIHWDLWW